MSVYGVTLLDDSALHLIQEADKWGLTPAQMVHEALDAYNDKYGRSLTLADLVEGLQKDAAARAEVEA